LIVGLAFPPLKRRKQRYEAPLSQETVSMFQNIWLRVVLATLATWRVTHLLAAEDGPFDVIARIRAWFVHGFLGKLMDCFYCLSLWVAVPTALAVTRSRYEWPLVWLALSGAACLLERLGPPELSVEPLGPEEQQAGQGPRNSD
jgi:hypothetical protein